MAGGQRQEADNAAQPLFGGSPLQYIANCQLAMFGQQLVQVATKATKVDLRLRHQVAATVNRDSRRAIGGDLTVHLSVARVVQPPLRN